jgi:hypothetical protein
MRRWTMLVIALVCVMAFETVGYAQTPSGSGDKMDKDKMMDKKDDKMMHKDKTMDKKMTDTDTMMDKKMMDKDKTMDKRDDKMMDKKQ